MSDDHVNAAQAKASELEAEVARLRRLLAEKADVIERLGAHLKLCHSVIADLDRQVDAWYNALEAGASEAPRRPREATDAGCPVRRSRL